ncbi:transmembrane domain-containing protein [Cryptosporidium canis]|uniref:Transmembrane domain-containing protein n=1 Tax=Cryptosporidium canis TaxID=195482 RepID=A0ABQ8P4E6_9CRYT|nr:transmembrane domain-containing protein [Cryptosporidium canis]KAJ1608537.1 transmembrane domain-containing protein [Cryptosporidium canis]
MVNVSENIKRGWKLILRRFLWEYKVSRALNRITFSFDEFDQTNHFNCSWIIPQWFLIYLRAGVFIYLLIVLGLDVANYYRLGCAMYWGVYVTNWTFSVTIIYYFFATTSTIYSYANNSIGRKRYIKSLELTNSPSIGGRIHILLDDSVIAHQNSRPRGSIMNILNQRCDHCNQPRSSIEVVVSDHATNGYISNSENTDMNGVQMVDLNLEGGKNKEASYGHASIVSISTDFESPDNLNKTAANNENSNSGKTEYILPAKTRNIFKRYINHLNSNTFIIKYCKETDRPHFADEINQRMDNTTTNINLHLLIRLMWVFHAIALPSSFIVGIVYWSMSIISPVGVDGFSFLTFNKHGLTAILLTLDTYFTTIPYFISQAFYSFLYCVIYTIFTIVYYILQLPNPQSQDDLGFIYSAINFADPAVSVPCTIGIFFLLFITANIIWFFVGFSRNHIIDPLPSDTNVSKEFRVNYYA